MAESHRTDLLYGGWEKIAINQRLVLLQQRRQRAALFLRGAGELQLGIDAVDVLFDSALGQKERLGNLAVRLAQRHQLRHRAFALGKLPQRLDRLLSAAGGLLPGDPALGKLADGCGKGRFQLARKRAVMVHQIRRVLGKRKHEPVRLGVFQRADEKLSCHCAVSERLIGACRLQADVQRDERVV